MKAVVTGGAGFIGRALCLRLMERGWRVCCVDRRSGPGTENVVLNLLTATDDELRGTLAGDVVFHLAANADPSSGGAGNVKMAVQVARMAQTEHLVLASSDNVYGPEAPVPPLEETQCVPASEYGWSKVWSEKAVCVLCGGGVTILRFSNVAGAPYGLLADLVARLKEDGSRLQLRSAGMEERSYVSLQAACDAYDTMSWRVRVPGEVKVFNVAGRDRVTVRRVAEIAVEEMGLATEIVLGPPGPPDRMGGDPHKLIDMGWEAGLRDSEQAVRSGVRLLL